MSKTQEDVVFTIKEVADKLKVKPQQVYKIVKDKSLGSILVGKAIRIPIEEFEKYRSTLKK